MRDIFYFIRELYPKNTPFVICTIIEKQGSTPRKEGAAMVVNRQGLVYGTIGGGAIEHRAILRAQEIMDTKINCNEKYILTKNEIEDLGMVCGGMNQIHFEYISNNEKFCGLDPNRPAYIVYHLSNHTGFDLFYQDKWLTENTEDLDIDLCKKKSSTVFSHNKNQYFSLKLFESSRAFLFGGGHVSRALSKLLDFLNFEVHIVENRKEFLQAEDFPRKAILHFVEYDNLDTLDISSSDYCCVLTRGHISDNEVVNQLLIKEPKYLGVIGSRKKSILLFTRLMEEGYKEEQVKKIHAPIGVDIAAETPEEIAVSIAAEMIQKRNGEIK